MSGTKANNLTFFKISFICKPERSEGSFYDLGKRCLPLVAMKLNVGINPFARASPTY